MKALFVKSAITSYGILIALLVIFIACEKNQAPVIESVTANPGQLEAGGTASLSVSASDPDGDELIYLWESSGGEISSENHLKTIIWEAPNGSGIFYCTVSVNDGKEIVKDSVRLEVSESPVLNIDRDTLYFTTDLTNEHFSISNQGTGLLDWAIQYSTDDGGSWIKSVSPAQGSTPGGNLENVNVEIDRASLAGGKYSGSINISSDAGNAHVKVMADVAELSVNPAQLDFGSAQSQKTFIVQNTGAGILHFTVSASDSWISIDPPAGSITTQQENVNVQVDRTGLSPGQYSGQAVISSNGGEEIVSVQMSVEANPVLHVNPDVITFGESDSNRSFSIQNTGGKTLNWTITDNMAWLNINPVSGSTTTETDVVEISADRTVLAAGTHSGIISVSSNGGNAQIQVSIIIVQQPVLKLNTNILDFGNTLTSRSFFIQNSGSGTLSWSITDNADWLTVNPISGTTTTETDNVQVIVNRSGLASGNHSAEIVVSSNGGDAGIDVSIQVDLGPVLQVSHKELDFGTSSGTMGFTISNAGDQTLNWEIHESLPWISVNKEKGSLDAESEDIIVTADRTGLSPGDHAGTITVKSNGGEQEIRVLLTIVTGSEWLSFDDGSFEGHLTTNSGYKFFLVQFDKPADWKEFTVTRIAISFDMSLATGPIVLYCFSTQLVNDKYYPYRSIFQTDKFDPVRGWNEWKVDWPLNIDRFCAGYMQTVDNSPYLHGDTSSPKLRSYYVDSNSVGHNVAYANWAIRVYVVRKAGEPSSGQWLDLVVTPENERDSGNYDFIPLKKGLK